MKSILAALLCGLLPGGASAAEKDIGSKLTGPAAAALQQLRSSDGYRFQVSPDLKKQKGVQGTYRKDQPVYFEADGLEFFKKGDTLVYRQGKQWHRTKTGVESDPLRILGPSAKIRQTALPHAELAGLARFIKSARQQKVGDALHVTAELTPAGCRRFLLPSDRDLAKQGKIILRVDSVKGRLLGYRTMIDIEGKRGNAEVQGTIGREVLLSDIGAARLDIPAAAQKALGATK